MVRVDPGLPLLQLDFVVDGAVLVNLLENAMKYTAPGQTISIHAFRDGDRAAIEVANEGVGIAPEDVDHIFEKFYRVQGATGSAPAPGWASLFVAAWWKRMAGTSVLDCRSRIGGDLPHRVARRCVAAAGTGSRGADA